jgi:hypothetical protein
MVVDVTRRLRIQLDEQGLLERDAWGTRLKDHPEVYLRTVVLTPPIYNPLRSNRRFRRLWARAVRSIRSLS